MGSGEGQQGVGLCSPCFVCRGEEAGLVQPTEEMAVGPKQQAGRETGQTMESVGHSRTSDSRHTLKLGDLTEYMGG